MKDIKINEILEQQKTDIGYGMIIRLRGKTVWVIHKPGKTDYPVKLIAFDSAEFYEEFESLDAIKQATSDIEILGKMRL